MPITHLDYSRILKGQRMYIGVSNDEVFDIRNISEANAINFTIKLKNLYHSVELIAKHQNDTVIKWIGVHENRYLPFFVSY